MKLYYKFNTNINTNIKTNLRKQYNPRFVRIDLAEGKDNPRSGLAATRTIPEIIHISKDLSINLPNIFSENKNDAS
jgi:hypothetical protein